MASSERAAAGVRATRVGTIRVEMQLERIDPPGAVPWASTLREHRSRGPNNLVYWEALQWAIHRGAQRFDFGRSPRAGGTHRFEVGWGAEERSPAWTRLGADGAALAGAGSAPGAAGLRPRGGVTPRPPGGTHGRRASSGAPRRGAVC